MYYIFHSFIELVLQRYRSSKRGVGLRIRLARPSMAERRGSGRRRSDLELERRIVRKDWRGRYCTLSWALSGFGSITGV